MKRREPFPLDGSYFGQLDTTQNATSPPSLARSISPPPRARARANPSSAVKGVLPEGPDAASVVSADDLPSLAAVEAGEGQIRDHVEYFSTHLGNAIRPSGGPRLALADYRDLYLRNQWSHGRHFVIHQHDHPVAGVHYDLRLQFSQSSSVSFAIMYGLPGNPISRRQHRQAVETRVHNMWRKIRLRLHGARLPNGYTITLRTGGFDNHDQRTSTHTPKRKRKRREETPSTSPSSASEDEEEEGRLEGKEKEAEDEDAATRATNAYPGATNAIGSVHQRRWLLSLDRAASGFVRSGRDGHGRITWVPRAVAEAGEEREEGHEEAGGWSEPFFVRGRDVERSVVTGRLAAEVMADEGVVGYVGRKGWRAVLE
ncbi:MAG: hypothetical protein M1832_000794 [Thelocarpon impressellum]|nr:MAG: hypothetical protein M1832_000794 [Thelocarpon impressellum]